MSEEIEVEKKRDILVERLKLPPIPKLTYNISVNNKTNSIETNVIKCNCVGSILVPKLKDNSHGITTLSVIDDSLLVSSRNNNQIYQYSKDGNKLKPTLLSL